MKLLKRDLEQMMKDRQLSVTKRMSKSKMMDILKDFDIRKMTEQTKDTIDPITREPFESWDFEEILSKLFINGYFYKEQSIREYVQHSDPSVPLRDPIQPSITIPTCYQQQYSITTKNIDQDDILFSHSIIHFQTDYFVFPFYRLEIKLRNHLVKTTLKQQSPGTYIIGVIPLNINNTEQFPYQMKALDATSTSEALLIRIQNLYLSGKMFTITKTHVEIQSLESLPKRCLHWFSTGLNDFRFIDTSPLPVKTAYNTLVEDLYQKL